MAERDQVIEARRAAILALPLGTLLRVGLRPPSGNIQGGVFWRAGDGLAPTSRDTTTRDVLRSECDGWLSHNWPWGFDVLAYPLDEPERHTPEGTMLNNERVR